MVCIRYLYIRQVPSSQQRPASRALRWRPIATVQQPRSVPMLAIMQRSFGGPEVLEVSEIDRPRPLPTEVLVRVRAVSVNPVETLIRSGAFPLLGDPPFILGWDVSGVVG